MADRYSRVVTLMSRLNYMQMAEEFVAHLRRFHPSDEALIVGLKLYFERAHICGYHEACDDSIARVHDEIEKAINDQIYVRES